MRQSLLTALLILLCAGVMAMGAPLDDAKKSNAAADKKLVAAGAELQAIVKSLKTHLSILADVAGELDQQRERQKQMAPLLSKALEAVNADLAAAKSEATAAENALRGASGAAEKARADLGPKRAAVERAASAERKAFESSPEYRAAVEQLASADAALAREKARLDAAFQHDPTIAPLVAAQTQTENELSAARAAKPIDEAAVAEASARWIAAKNALTAAQSAAYAKDDAFVQAQQAASAATNARTALSDAFDKSILGQPGVAEAQLALRDAQNLVKLAEAAEAAARADVAAAGRWLISRRASADAITRIIRDADDSLAGTAGDLKRAQDAGRAIGQDLAAAATHVLAIRDDVKTTADAVTAAGKR